jgi:hypothetical protein
MINANQAATMQAKIRGLRTNSDPSYNLDHSDDKHQRVGLHG